MSQKSAKGRQPGSARRPARPNRLPLIVTAVGVVLLGLAGFLAWRASSGPAVSTGAAILKADKDKVDLGDVRLGQTVSVAFELTNTGDAPLRFTEAPFIEVAAGC
jgi:hypothetical protein